jgi:hypothetical protein
MDSVASMRQIADGKHASGNAATGLILAVERKSQRRNQEQKPALSLGRNAAGALTTAESGDRVVAIALA